ncbi:MAG: GIY-YIG nuclease family protein [Candidatus Dojkabacteria bacterium]|nr:GIY-YIG nuclease family protein [Candidatus Dojkabacteria bacterium]
MYYIYILLCKDNSLYTGFTTDIAKRLEDHRSGRGSKYVRSRLPVKLIYSERFRSKSRAMKREAQIKGWRREDKIENIQPKAGSPLAKKLKVG